MATGGVHVGCPSSSREPNTAVSLAYSPCAAVVDEVQVAVGQLGQAGRMLVRAGRHFRPEHAFDREASCGVCPETPTVARIKQIALVTNTCALLIRALVMDGTSVSVLLAAAARR